MTLTTQYLSGLIMAISVFMYSDKSSKYEQYKSNKIYDNEEQNNKCHSIKKYHSMMIDVTYQLNLSENIGNVLYELEDSVFNRESNKISTLMIEDNYDNCVILATVPISDIIIKDEYKIVICLSRIQLSRYHIIIYDFDGNCLYKKRILPLEIKIPNESVLEFCNQFYELYQYAIKNDQVVKTDSCIYVDMGYWRHLSEKEKDSLRNTEWIKPSHLFPNIGPRSMYQSGGRMLGEYGGFYSMTDPFYEIEESNDSLLNIVLNDEYGGRVSLPLNILKPARLLPR